MSRPVGDNEKDKFIQTSEGTAVRVSPFGGSFLSGISFDEVQVTYPTSTTEVYTYNLNAVTVATLTATYTNECKDELTSVVKS